MLRETKSRVKVGNEMGESFWTAKGIRQGCPINFLLFSILLADIKEEMRKVKWGGIRLGEERIYSLLYADDLALMAENEGEMRSLIERLEKSLEKKKLELNIRKTNNITRKINIVRLLDLGREGKSRKNGMEMEGWKN